MAEFVALLERLRVWSGNPSLRVLAKKVGPLLRPPRPMSHTTLADAFKPGRRRLDLAMVVAIVRALGLENAEVACWRDNCVRVHAEQKTGGQIGAFRQLPADLATFTGRQDDLKQILDAATTAVADGRSAAVVVTAIDGMAGIGKTTLAVHAGHLLSERFPDGQLFVDLHGFTQGLQPRTAADVLADLLRTLRVPPQQIPRDVDARAALYRDRLSGKQILVVLDNAIDEDQVRPLLPGHPGCLVLVTSRRRLKGLDEARIVSLDVLPLPDALVLLRTIAGPGRVSPDDPMLEEIALLCGNLPLALRIAGALLRHRPSWTLAHLGAKLRDAHSALAVFHDGDRDLTALFNLSYAALPEDQKLLFRRLGLHPGPDIDSYATAALLDTAPPQAEAGLQYLVDHNLLAETSPGRYRMHDLTRTHARTLAATSDDSTEHREMALDRLLRYYAHTALRASLPIGRLPRPEPAGPAPAHAPGLTAPETARAWLRAEYPNLDAAHAHAHAYHLDHHAIALAAGMAEILLTDAPLTRAVQVHEAAETAARLDHPAGHANALADLGRVKFLSGEFSEAAAAQGQALDICRQIGNRLGEANALNNLGRLRYRTGDLPEAAAAQAQALEIYHQIGNRLGEANAMTDLGQVRVLTGDLPGAADAHAQALEIYRQIGNRHGEATALAGLGQVRVLTGDLPGAADAQAQTLEIYRQIGNRLGEATALADLGEVRKASGDYPEAADALTRALETYRQIGNRHGEGYALNHLGQVLSASGDHAGAEVALARALEIYRQMGGRGDEAWTLNYYAAAIAALGDRPRALTLYSQALEMNQELHKPDDEARSLEGLADHHLATGDPAQGIAYLNQALEIYQRLDMRPDIERVQTCLAASGPGV